MSRSCFRFWWRIRNERKGIFRLIRRRGWSGRKLRYRMSTMRNAISRSKLNSRRFRRRFDYLIIVIKYQLFLNIVKVE
jgi:hypothetical protein